MQDLDQSLDRPLYAKDKYSIQIWMNKIIQTSIGQRRILISLQKNYDFKTATFIDQNSKNFNQFQKPFYNKKIKKMAIINF